jgi:FdhE protein
MPFDVIHASRLLEKKLKDIERKTVLPAAMLDLVAATARAQLAARAIEPVSIPETTLEDVERNLRGAPMLPREAFPVELTRAAALFEELSRLVAANQAHLAEALAGIHAALAAGELRLETAFSRYMAGDDAFFVVFGERSPSAPRLLNFLVQAALAPQLAAVAEAVYAHFPAERTWNFGHCPVCGSLPFMARLLGTAGARHLSCSYCQLEYRAKRLLCPYCGEEDHTKLEVFTSADEPGYAVHVCLRCKTYIKTVDFREFDRPSIHVLDDLESLTLDLAARGQGYARPVLSAWGF